MNMKILPKLYRLALDASKPYEHSMHLGVVGYFVQPCVVLTQSSRTALSPAKVSYQWIPITAQQKRQPIHYVTRKTPACAVFQGTVVLLLSFETLPACQPLLRSRLSHCSSTVLPHSAMLDLKLWPRRRAHIAPTTTDPSDESKSLSLSTPQSGIG